MRFIAGLALLLFAIEPAVAQKARNGRPEAFRKLIDCRAVSDAAERLSCFDREASAIDAAEARKDLVIFDRAEVRRTQRSLFGLALPNLTIFGDGSDDAEKEITSTIKRVWPHSYGKWAFELADGAQWEQTDVQQLPLDPKPGQSIRIRRAALGSYMANVNQQIGIRVRRIR